MSYPEPHPWLATRDMDITYDNGCKIHESVMRSFHIVSEVRRLLELSTPPSVVLQIMDLLEGK